MWKLFWDQNWAFLKVEVLFYFLCVHFPRSMSHWNFLKVEGVLFKILGTFYFQITKATIFTFSWSNPFTKIKLLPRALFYFPPINTAFFTFLITLAPKDQPHFYIKARDNKITPLKNETQGHKLTTTPSNPRQPLTPHLHYPLNSITDSVTTSVN